MDKERRDSMTTIGTRIEDKAGNIFRVERIGDRTMFGTFPIWLSVQHPESSYAKQHEGLLRLDDYQLEGKIEEGTARIL